MPALSVTISSPTPDFTETELQWSSSSIRVDYAHLFQKNIPHFFKSELSTILADFTHLEQKIDEVCAMPDNWDGYGALCISDQTKKNAQLALKELVTGTFAPDIIPNPNGTLTFEWASAKGIANLEIGQTRYSFFIDHAYGPPILVEGDAKKIASQALSAAINAVICLEARNSDPITDIQYV